MPDIATLLGLLGVSGVSVYKGATMWRQRALEQIAKAEVTRLAESRAEATRRGLHVEALRHLYAPELTEASGLSFYAARCGDLRIETAMVGPAEQCRLTRRFASEPFRAIEEGTYRLTSTAMPALSELAAAHLEGLRKQGITITNRPVYRLLDVAVGDDDWRWEFALDHYANWHRDMAALGDELWRGLHEVRNDVPRLVERRRELLPRREERLRTAHQLTDFRSRVTAGGPTITCAFRRGGDDDYVIPVRMRKSSLASGAGLLGIIAQGMHQPAVDARQDTSLVLTAWRELFEELLQGKEVEDDDAHLRPGWFLKPSEPLGWFSTHDGWSLYATGFAIDLMSGTYDLSLLLVVDDPDFFDRHESKFKANWEFVSDAAHSPFVSTKDEAALLALLAARNWASSSQFSFVRGLITLQGHSPAAVALPTISDTP